MDSASPAVRSLLRAEGPRSRAGRGPRRENGERRDAESPINLCLVQRKCTYFSSSNVGKHTGCDIRDVLTTTSRVLATHVTTSPVRH